MKPARRARNSFDSRYLVYLNNRAAGKGSVKTIDLCDQKTAPLTPKSFIYNRRSYSFENITFKLLIRLVARVRAYVGLRCERECKRFPSERIDGIWSGQPVSLLASYAECRMPGLLSETGGPDGPLKTSAVSWVPGPALVQHSSVSRLLLHPIIAGVS